MPEYVEFSPISKRITKKWFSVDPSVVNGLPNILEISRDVFNTLTKFHKVENGQVALMTQIEKDALLAEEAQAVIDAENARILDLDTKILNNFNGITLANIDTKIDNINTLNDAKTFLKKLCRYTIKHIAG